MKLKIFYDRSLKVKFVSHCCQERDSNVVICKYLNFCNYLIIYSSGFTDGLWNRPGPSDAFLTSAGLFDQNSLESNSTTTTPLLFSPRCLLEPIITTGIVTDPSHLGELNCFLGCSETNQTSIFQCLRFLFFEIFSEEQIILFTIFKCF